MKLTIESTSKMTTIDGVQVRVWEGKTEDGTKCVVMVHRIAVQKDEDLSQFEKELREQLPPGRSFPLSAVLLPCSEAAEPAPAATGRTTGADPTG